MTEEIQSRSYVMLEGLTNVGMVVNLFFGIVVLFTNPWVSALCFGTILFSIFLLSKKDSKPKKAFYKLIKSTRHYGLEKWDDHV